MQKPMTHQLTSAIHAQMVHIEPLFTSSLVPVSSLLNFGVLKEVKSQKIIQVVEAVIQKVLSTFTVKHTPSFTLEVNHHVLSITPLNQAVTMVADPAFTIKLGIQIQQHMVVEVVDLPIFALRKTIFIIVSLLQEQEAVVETQTAFQPVMVEVKQVVKEAIMLMTIINV